MRILVLANLDIGLYKFRRELLEKLAENNEVIFCVPRGEYVTKITELGCRYIPSNELNRRSINPFADIKLLLRYIKILRDIKPDCVLTYTIKPNVYGGIACTIQNIPYLVNVTGLGTSIENGGLLATVSKTLYRIGLRNANCVFFQNSANRRFFIDNKLVKGATRVIPGSGVNLETFSFEPYPSDTDETHFLYVGRIMKDKGIKELLDAMYQLKKTNDKVFLDIIGFCDDNYSDLLRKSESLGIIKYYGMQDEVNSFYKKCHCVVLPSYHEGTSNVMLEASSTGRPVITTRVPGCRETFDENITGFGCEAKSTESLLSAMETFVALPSKERENMGIAARRKMEKEYDRNLVLNAYLQEIVGIRKGQKT